MTDTTPGYELFAAISAARSVDLLAPWHDLAEQMDPAARARYDAAVERQEIRARHGELFADLIAAAIVPNDHTRQVLADLTTEGNPE